MTLLNCKIIQGEIWSRVKEYSLIVFITSQAPLGSLAYVALPLPIDVIITLSYLAYKHAAHVQQYVNL